MKIEIPRGWTRTGPGRYECKRLVLVKKNRFGCPWQLEDKSGTPMGSYNSPRDAFFLLGRRGLR
jgi:hypothetical protein